MSRENVEVVREMFDAFNRGDYKASLDVLDEAVEWQDPPEIPGGGVHRGPAEVTRWFARWMGAWDEFRFVPEEVIDAGSHVVVVIHWSGRGRDSGVEVDHRTAQVYELRNGRIVRMRPFNDRSRALEAVGLRE